MRLMAGLDRPREGRILVDGRDVTGSSARKRDVAMVYQQFINYPTFTVFDNIAAPLKRATLAKSEVDAEKWLAQPGSPKAKLANGKPQGETVDYDGLLQAWREGRVR